MTGVYLVIETSLKDVTETLRGIFVKIADANNYADAYADFGSNETFRTLEYGCVRYDLKDSIVSVRFQEFGKVD